MIPNKNAFETKIEQLDYQKKRSHFCKAGTIANAFSDNAIFNLPVNKWEEQNAPNRIIMLRDKLREELEL